MGEEKEKHSPATEKFTLGKDTVRLPERFKELSKVVLRDLNNNRRSPSFSRYTKTRIMEYLENPYRNQKALRDASIYIYGVSTHYRRIINYFAGLSDLSYVLSPYKVDTSTAKPESIASKYRKCLNILTSMDIENQFRKILVVCFREDTFYGYLRDDLGDVITLQQLPSDYCDISVIENNVLNVTFDFSYFTSDESILDYYPAEFRQKYNQYLKNRNTMRWQELQSPNAFAVKANVDILEYAIPPLAGIFAGIYDLEDYKQLKLTKEELENYAVLVMHLGINDDGDWQMPLEQAKEFWRNLDGILPEEIGSILSPMPIDKISFERNHAKDSSTTNDAEEEIFTAAGVSSLLFNNAKASSNALLLSIKADQCLTYALVQQIEAVINRYIQAQSYGRNFKTTFLDVSPFNRKEMGDQYLKAATYGMPAVTYYCVSQGISQNDMDQMNFLEQDVLGIASRFKPVQSSNTTSSADSSSGGRPKSDIGELSDNGEISQEGDDGDDKVLE